MPCRNYTPCILLEISGVNLCSSAFSWIALFFAVRSCNLLEVPGSLWILLYFSAFPCIALHSLGSLCRFLDELGSLEELIAPSGSKKNRGRRKKSTSFWNTLASQNRKPLCEHNRRLELQAAMTEPWDDDAWFDCRKAASFLGLTPSGVRSLVSRGVLTPDGRGPRRTLMFRLSTLDRWLSDGCRRYAAERYATSGTGGANEQISVSGNSTPVAGSLSSESDLDRPEDGQEEGSEKSDRRRQHSRRVGRSALFRRDAQPVSDERDLEPHPGRYEDDRRHRRRRRVHDVGELLA